MTPNHLRLLIGMALLVSGVAYTAVHFFGASVSGRYGSILHETRSDFSHLRVREKGTVRSLLFVDEDGKEQCQSSLDLAAPGENQLGYTRSLFASLLFTHPQERVLIVGLGGGGMVRFLNHAFPGVTVEAVEIDPVVVRVASVYFGTVPGPKTVIHTMDAFVYFAQEQGGYDAIYMDAFLRPPADSGLDEKTSRLKTGEFLERLGNHLRPGGVVAFNLIESDPGTPDDIASIRRAFSSTFLFDVPGSRNLVVIASREAPGPGPDELRKRAVKLDEELSVGLSFRSLADNLRQ